MADELTPVPGYPFAYGALEMTVRMALRTRDWDLLERGFNDIQARVELYEKGGER